MENRGSAKGGGSDEDPAVNAWCRGDVVVDCWYTDGWPIGVALNDVEQGMDRPASGV